MIARAQQQRNTTATQFDSSELFVRRLEEHERTSSVLTEESYAQEITLIGYLHQLLQSLSGILNEQRCHYKGIAEESERYLYELV